MKSSAVEHEIYLLLGTNLGDRVRNLEDARRLIGEVLSEPTGVSKIYQTAPWGVEDQPQYLNQVLRLNSNLPPMSVLDSCLKIELELGRIRERKWGERTIDIDVLFYDDHVISTPELIVPHPRLQDRKFTLVPLNELAANKLHPLLKVSVRELLDSCEDELEVELFEI